MINPAGRQDIPRRYGSDLAEGHRQAKPLRRFITGDPTPTKEQWRAIGESLHRGDRAMDSLVEWMIAEGGNQSRTLFERVLTDGIDHVPEAPDEIRAFFVEIEQRPSWVNAERLERGARACGISGMTGLRVLRDFGLMAGYQAGAINRPLIMTGALEKGSQRRVAETTKWWVDATRPGGIDRGAPGWISTLRVRMIHAYVRRALMNNENWDYDELGLPLNQCDMHVTWLAFSVIFLLGQRLMGVYLTRQERDDVMHLWRYIGWLLGVDPDLLTDNEMAGRTALYQNILGQAPADETTYLLGRALMDEPLERNYPNWGWLRGRWNRALHLSLVRTFVGTKGMRALGLPVSVLPWYPLLSFTPRLLWHVAHRLVPGGRDRLVRQGLEVQSDYLNVLFGTSDRELLAIS